MTFYNKYGHYVNVLLLVTVSVLVFLSCLDSYFMVIDDVNVIARGQTGDIFGVLFRNTYGGHQGGNYRPIEVLSHFMDLQLFGWESTDRRLTNLLVHILNVLLVYAIAFHLSPIRIVGFVAALLFAVHPLHAQALPPVAWISGRTELFVTVFYLLAVLLFVRATLKQSYSLYILSLVSFMLALLSKELAVTLPLIILTYCLLLHHRLPTESWLDSKQEPIVRKTLLVLGVLAMIVGVAASPSVIRAYVSPDGVLDGETIRKLQYLRLVGLVGGASATLYGLLLRRVPAPALLRTTAKYVLPYFLVLGLYLVARFWVIGSLGGAYQTTTGNVALQIGPDSFLRDVFALAGLVWPVGFGYNIVVFALQISHPAVFYGVSILASLGLGLVLLTGIRKSRVGALALLWIFITLLPVHNIIIPSGRFQARFLYLPAVGFCIGLSLIWYRISQTRVGWQRVAVTVGLALVILVSAGGIVTHNAALSKSGEITRGLVTSIRNNQRDIVAASDLMYLTYPLSVGETRYVAANAYLAEVLRASGVQKDVGYHLLLYLEEDQQADVEVALEDGAFLVDIVGSVTCFWMPQQPSALERRIKEIYLRQPDDRMLQPLPTQGTVETDEARMTVLQVDTIARRIRVKIEVKDSTAGKRWFVYDNGRFDPLERP